LLAYYRFLL